ncbi:DUF1684 domain-containing protein [Catalinimonas niigatensis]|uniref:DUF1684 domain-containing protein n=1 Tax=Catalinimonas niigatensis TaxID=1397264 RepID=UPI002664F5AD|nr:DUF1684 domain-containing protein [Catalinimonas niigatensis]WPP53360.1 DUF1684 domain-containing protein [Catalinimonas niigatensis]
MKKVIPVIVIIVIGISIIYALQGGESEEDYGKRIMEERKRTERFMRSSDESPFAPEDIPFKGLDFYEPKPAYRIRARLTPIEDHKLLQMPTSTGEEEKYIRYAYADFEMEGQPVRLLLLQPFDSQSKLFLPFSDATSGEETYGGGRYLDIEMPALTSKSIELDFNKAYNPYCAYNPTYSCPLPPKENILDIPIRAGEKAYKE